MQKGKLPQSAQNEPLFQSWAVASTTTVVTAAATAS